jgi:hypothetical protein
MPASACLYSFSTPLRNVLPDETRRLSTRATRVAIKPVVSLMTSIELELRWCVGRCLRSVMPMPAPAKGQTKASAKKASDAIMDGATGS